MTCDPDTDTPMLPPGNCKSRKLNQYIAATSASLGTFCGGTCLSWTSPVFSQLSLPENATSTPENGTLPDLPEFILTQSEQAAIASTLTIGALIAALPAGYLASKIGRKPLILSLSVAFLLNWIFTVCAQSAALMITGRFFAGIGMGAICVAAPMYIAEISESSNRGVLGSFTNIFLGCGITVTCILGSFTPWRIMSGVLAIFPVLFGVTFFFMPESPVYLVEKNRIADAEISLLRLRGGDFDVTQELKDLQWEVEGSRQKSSGGLDSLRNRGNLRALLAVVPVLAFQQLCGVNAVVFYTAPIFKAAGSSLPPDVAAIVIALVQVTASLASIFVIEKANRRFYLMASSTGMVLFHTAIAMYFHLQSLEVDIAWLGFLPIMSAVLFMVCFSMGYGPVPWMLMGELYSSEVKAFGTGLAIVANWGSAFLITFFFPLINGSWGVHVSFYICTVIMAVATVYVYFMVPETRGKTRAEIQEELNR